MNRQQPHAQVFIIVLCLVAGGIIAFAAWWLLVYDNYHEAIPGQLYRSGQMSSSQLSRHVVQDRIATVINLRPDTNEIWHAKEVQVCIEKGISHIDFPMLGDIPPSHEDMEALVTLMSRYSRPILIHCEHGADRTGLAVALYLRALENLPSEEAARSLSLKYGHLPVMRGFDRAFREYCKE